MSKREAVRLRVLAVASKTALAAVLLSGLAGQSALGQTPTGTFAQAGQGGCPAVPAINVAFTYLLTDGTVMVHDQSSQYQNWWRLAPDNTGSYLCGTWTQLASIPASFNYGPRFYAAAVLPDGRLIIAGGEYNLGSGTQSQTALSAIYNPRTNQWLPVRPPTGWTTIGDAQGAVLPSGQWLIADSQSTKQALFNANNLTWTPTGSSFPAGTNDEAAWTLLPDGTILTVNNNAGSGPLTASRWITFSAPNPQGGTWYSAGTVGQQLYDARQEIGPGVLMMDGKVLVLGATGNTSIYTPPPASSPPSTATGSWANSTVLPATCAAAGNLQCVAADSPAALLPSGNVLTFSGVIGDGTGPNEFRKGSQFFEFDRAVNPPVWNAPTIPGALATQILGDAGFVGTLLMLPNGQVLFADGIGGGNKGVWTYTPQGTANAAWQPTITSFPNVINRNQTYNIFGTLFNGMSQTTFYGDDWQAATNYPIIQVTINATGHVFYGRTHDHSAMGVARVGVPVSTKFELYTCPQVAGSSCVAETGAATLRVIANGIASNPVNVTIN